MPTYANLCHQFVQIYGTWCKFVINSCYSVQFCTVCANANSIKSCHPVHPVKAIATCANLLLSTSPMPFHTSLCQSMPSRVLSHDSTYPGQLFTLRFTFRLGFAIRQIDSGICLWISKECADMSFPTKLWEAMKMMLWDDDSCTYILWPCLRFKVSRIIF